MELEDVEFVSRHLVNDWEEGLLAEEVTAEIDQQSAPAKARGVRDIRRSYGSSAAGLIDDELPERLRSVEEAALIRRFDQHDIARCT